MRLIQLALILCKKEIQVQLRSIHSFGSMVMLGFCMLFIFHFSLEKERPLDLPSLVGIKWALLFFLSYVLIGPSVWSDKELGAGSIVASLAPPYLVYLTKSLTVWVLLVAATGILLLGMGVFFQNFHWTDVLGQLVILPWTSLSLSFLGVSLSYLSSSSRWKEMVLPLLLVPYSIPLFLYGIQSEFQYLEYPENLKNSLFLEFFFCVFYGSLGALFQELQSEEMDGE